MGLRISPGQTTVKVAVGEGVVMLLLTTGIRSTTINLGTIV
jgi:hypothetical protein